MEDDSEEEEVDAETSSDEEEEEPVKKKQKVEKKKKKKKSDDSDDDSVNSDVVDDLSGDEVDTSNIIEGGRRARGADPSPLPTPLTTRTRTRTRTDVLRRFASAPRAPFAIQICVCLRSFLFSPTRARANGWSSVRAS